MPPLTDPKYLFRGIADYDYGYDEDSDIEDTINLNLNPSINPSTTTYTRLDSHSRDSTGPVAGDNDADVYDYDEIITDAPVAGPGPTDAGNPDDSEMRVKSTSFDNGEGSTIYDRKSGTYDQMYDYATGAGGYRHHRERMTEDGVYQARDVQRRGDGSRHVHREYENPVTGTSTVRDYER